MPKNSKSRQQLFSTAYAGVASALAFLCLLLAFNTGGLADTIYAAEDPILPLAMLASMFTVLFAVAAICTSLGSLSDEEDEGRLVPAVISRQRSGGRRTHSPF